MQIKYGEIWWVDFIGSQGHEFQKIRPALVIEEDRQLSITTVITMMPVTHQRKNQHQDDIVIIKDDKNNLEYDSILKVHHILSYDKSRFVKKIGIADAEILELVKQYLKKHFDL
jgi:mRNA interferase MazF